MTNKIEPYKDIAGIYEEIRPSYPEELIMDITVKTNLRTDDILLEIGAGTGKATIQFAKRGYMIKAVEIGEDMARILKAKCADYSNVTVDIASFEEWRNPDNQKYDMIYSAQAFHWIDKSIKYRKCYELLKEEGYLVLFWYNASNQKSDKTKELLKMIDMTVSKYIKDYYKDDCKPKRTEHDGVSKEDERINEIESSGLFEVVEKSTYTYKIDNNAAQHLKAMKSVPAIASKLDGIDDKIIEKMDFEIEEIINKHGGKITTIFAYNLYIAKKVSNR